MAALSSADQELLQVVIAIGAALGLLGALFIISMFTCYKHLRSFAFRLVFYLALCDAGDTIVTLIGTGTKAACALQGVAHSFFSLASVFWIDVIAWVLYSSVVGQRDDARQKEPTYVCGVFGVSLVLALAPLLSGSYDESISGLCWLSEKSQRTTALVWQLVQFYSVLWFSFFFATWCYYRVYKSSQYLLNSISDMSEDLRENTLRRTGKLMYYPLTLVCAYFFSTVDRFYLFFNFNSPSLTLLCLHNALASMMGLMNCIVYGLNTRVREQIMDCCSKAEPEHSQELAGV